MSINFPTPVSTGYTSGGVVLTQAYTVPAGAKELWIFAYVDNANITVPLPDLMEYGGLAATLVDQIPTDAGGTGQLHFFYKILNPVVGTANIRARHPTLSIAIDAVCLTTDQNYIMTVSAFSYSNTASPSVSIASASGDKTLYSITVNNVNTTDVTETGGQSVLGEGGTSVNAMHQISEEVSSGATNGATWTVTGAQRTSRLAINIHEIPQEILTFTNPIIPGAAAAGTQTGFADGAITAAFGGITFAGTVAGSDISGTFAGFVDGNLSPLLPATSVSGTFTQGSDVANLSRDMSSPAGLQELRDIDGDPANFGILVLGNPRYIGQAFVDAGNALTTSDRSYVDPSYGLLIDQDGRVRLNNTDHPTDPVPSLPYVTTLWIRRGSDGKTYSHSLSISGNGVTIDFGLIGRGLVGQSLSGNSLQGNTI